MLKFINGWLVYYGINERLSIYLSNTVAAVAIIILCLIADLSVKKFLLKAVESYIYKSKNKWDDVLLEKKFFAQIARIVPGIVVQGFASVFSAYQSWIQRIASIYIVIIVLLSVDIFLDAVDEIYRKHQKARTKPIKGYLQVIEITVFILGAIMIISYLINRPPWIMLSGIGAATAIASLIFKDSILGLVASIQLTLNNMIRLGDWIEMPSYGADGDVVDISLHTVKVQNWNKTISTIPTHALITGSFKNWNGMLESEGRRIKRHIYLDMTSIRFCTEEMLERFEKVQYLQSYLSNANGRKLTNTGVFRAYLEEYLKNHPKINKNMTQMVRQLQPTEYGLPIEIYAFTAGTEWAACEKIQADIFDHAIAVIPEFDLQVYQSPSGYDLRNLR